MCEPTLIISAVIGGVQTITTWQQQKRAWQDQIRANDWSDMQARQRYLNDLNIASHKDQIEGRKFQADLEATAASKTTYSKRLAANQLSQSIASMAEQNKLQEKVKKAAFESNKKLKESIAKQGTILAGDSALGASMMYQLQEVERNFGVEEAELNATLFDANRAYAMTELGLAMQKHSADVSAYTDIYPGPQIAPSASWGPIVPQKTPDPRAPSPLGAIIQGVMTGVSAYGSMGGPGFSGGGSGPTAFNPAPGTYGTNIPNMGVNSGFTVNANPASDIRLKENIVKVGKALSGLNIYEWNYKSAPNSRYRGVIAQEVIKIFPEAVIKEKDGFLSVIYDLLDVNMELII